MGSTRIKGNEKPVLTLGSPGTDHAVDLLSATIENEEAESDQVTFEDAASGNNRDYFLRGSAIQSTATGSFWSYVWDNSGDTDIAYTYAPHGNATPSASQPHFVGTLTLGPKPSIGGEAGNSAYVFDFEFKLDGEPAKDISA